MAPYSTAPAGIKPTRRPCRVLVHNPMASVTALPKKSLEKEKRGIAVLPWSVKSHSFLDYVSVTELATGMSYCLYSLRNKKSPADLRGSLLSQEILAPLQTVVALEL